MIRESSSKGSGNSLPGTKFYHHMQKYEWHDTADFIEKVLGVYNHSMETIYPSLSAQVAVGTFLMKSQVHNLIFFKIKKPFNCIHMSPMPIYYH